MTTQEQFQQYVWITETIYKTRRITLEELNERWQDTEMSGGLPMPRATFKRNRIAIEDMFGLIIECDSDYRYYIANREVLREYTVQKWMLDIISVGCIIRECLALQDRILIEPLSYGVQVLRVVTEAMRRNHTLQMNYRCYGRDESRAHTVEPYGLKFYRHRLYMLGHYGSGNFSVFSLDRIHEIGITENKFELERDFDTKTFFQDYFGVIISGKEERQRIVLRAYGWERHSMRDLPMHCSQRELERGEDYVDYEIIIHPTNDLKGYILSRGQWLVVKYPQWYADEIKNELQEMISRY